MFITLLQRDVKVHVIQQEHVLIVLLRMHLLTVFVTNALLQIQIVMVAKKQILRPVLPVFQDIIYLQIHAQVALQSAAYA